MSRYAIQPRPAFVGLTVVIGWDNPLMTFFAQAYREPEEANEDRDMILWAGTDTRELATLDALRDVVAPYADIPGDTEARLRADHERSLDSSPTPLQRMMLLRMRRFQ